jgi:hypothetical protein
MRRHAAPQRPQLHALALLLLALLSAHHPAPAAAQAANLLKNSGFESGAAEWEFCGAAESVDAQVTGTTPAMVYAGRRAVRLTFDENNRCGEVIFDPYAAAAQTISIPASAQDVTVSFRYSRVGNPVFPLKVTLAEPDGFNFLAQVDIDNLPGWHLFRYELTAEQLARVRGRHVQLLLATEFYSSSSSPPQAARPGFYLDDVRVVAGLERTATAARPADLRADGTAPIVYLDAELGGIARMEADGSRRRLIYSNRPAPLSPAWSSAGDRVAVIEGSLTPANSSDVRVNPAFISLIKVLSASGGSAREIYRTSGVAGFRPTVPTTGDPERPALDVEASSIAWSPDDRQIALSLCASNRSKSGSTSDPICWVELIEVATGQSKGKYEPGFAPRWSRSNRIIYSNEDAYKAKAQGIYEVDRSVSPTIERLLVPGMGGQFKPAQFNDRSPAWSPDGTRFATVRNVSGNHYNEGGGYVVHYGIMLFTRGNPLGRQILLSDHGDSISRLSWSPDGKFIIYTLYTGDRGDIWWLDTRSGATGPLTSNGASAAGDWWPISLAALTQRAYLPLLRR